MYWTFEIIQHECHKFHSSCITRLHLRPENWSFSYNQLNDYEKEKKGILLIHLKEVLLFNATPDPKREAELAAIIMQFIKIIERKQTIKRRREKYKVQ